MKILMLSTFDLEGGAARASWRLFRGLKDLGADPRMLVQGKSGEDAAVLAPPGWAGKNFTFLRPKLESVPVRLRHRVDKARLFSPAWVPDGLGSRVAAEGPDILHLHWVNYAFLRIETLARIPGPKVWTLHDMWAFTGGCHYDEECGRYKDACGACPQLGSSREGDLSRRVLDRKKRAWEKLDLTVVTPSRWLADCARASSLFRGARVEVIPYGMDLGRYRPLDKAAAREILGLPKDRNLILFGAFSASDKRKGFDHLQAAMRHLASEGGAAGTELVVFGSGRPAVPPDLGFPIHYTGRLYDDVSLSLLYSAADLFVAPSMQDNLPNTVMEAMACGTPCVAFRIGGMPDMIDHGKNGFLAAPFAAREMAEAIARLLADPGMRAAFGRDARAKAEREYPSARQAEAYLALYRDILARAGRRV